MTIGTNDFFSNFIIGGFAGGLSRTVTSPLEITKMLKQNYPNCYGKQNTPQIIYNIYKQYGFKALFKGNIVNCMRIIPQNAIQLSIYNYSSNYIQKSNPEYKNLNTFISGSIAGILSYSAVYPLETIRSKLSVNIDGKYGHYNSIQHAFRHTYSTYGLRSLYNGWAVSAIGMIPYQGITYLSYQYLRDMNDVSNWSIVNGAIASFSAVSVTYPCDVIKRKYHLSGELGNKRYLNYRDLLSTMYKETGIVGFYRGIGACYSKMVPAGALFFYTVEWCNHIMNIKHEQ